MKLKHFMRPMMVAVIGVTGYHTAWSQSKPANLRVNTAQDLDVARKKIDSLDSQLINIIGERERIAQAIGVYKATNNIPPLQPARFKQVIDRSIEAGKKQGLSPYFVTEIMNAIHKESLRIEGDTAKLGH
jgi:chorismate mutase